MNIETINKWLDEEYGCSYTRLEELHDWLLEENMQKDIDKLQLQSNWNSLREWLENEKTQMEGYFDTVLDKMNELEGKDKE